MMPSAPWNGTVSTLRNAASDRHISGMLHEIGKVFIGGKAEPRRRTIDHGVHRIRERSPPCVETATMTRILTISSGAATPNIECSACATQGFSGAASILANGARAKPSSEMLAAPSRNAVQTLTGGPGRSPAAITSHNISSAGATAAVPMTVGRDLRRFIGMASMPSFRLVGALKACRPTASRGQQVSLNSRRRGGHSAAAADILQPRIHQRILGADRIHTGRGIGFRRGGRTQRRLCGCG